MKTSVAAILGGATTVLAAVRGFNYGAQGQSQAAFEASFKSAQNLQGASGFNSARLYTMIQEGTTADPIDAIPAALDTNTTLLLGLWTSSPQATFDHEITALKTAISQYGSDLAKLVVGISVGSEDLYRISTTGIANDPLGVGQSPSQLVNYISQVRSAIKGTVFANVPIGHVDTWNAFVNGSNSAVIAACDFLGLDEYPYYQTTDSNGIESAQSLFFQAYDKVSSVASGKQIWVTESGWPVSGKQSGQAIASVSNAATFWQDVACELESRNINFWWYILEDSATPSFSVSQGGKPLYDLSCHAAASVSTTGRNTTSATGSVSGSASGSRTLSSSATGTGSSRTTISGAANAQSTGSSGSSSVSGSGSATTTSRGSSSASGSGSAVSPTVSSFKGAGRRIEASFAGLLFAAFVAALTL